VTLTSVAPEILDRMQVEYLMWSAFVDGVARPLQEPLVLPRDEWHAAARLCEDFARLVRRTIALCHERPELLGFFGLEPGLRRMFAAEAQRPAAAQDCLMRFDLFRTASGWQICEVNSDVPGGIHEAQALHDLVGSARGTFRVVEATTDMLCRDTVRPAVGILYASGFGEDLEQCQFLRRAWNRLGIPAVLGAPRNLRWSRGRLRLFGEPLDVVYRFFPMEWLLDVPEADALLHAVEAGKVRMINPFSQVVAQSKKGMALWHGRPDLFTAAENALIRRHLPRTDLFAAERLPGYRSRRAELVVKRAFGRVGEQVLPGFLHDDAEWEEALQWPLSEPGEWIVQERFTVLPERLLGEDVYPCFGGYVVGERFAGFYTRLSREPFIAADAYTAAVVPAAEAGRSTP
jgi:glutathionylspermidine synthase